MPVIHRFCPEILPMKLKHAKAAIDLVDRHVTLHNDLVVASHGLKTLAEQRIVKSCAAKIDSVRLENNRYKIKLNAREYAETFGLDMATAYEQLKSGCTELTERWIEWSETVVKERGVIAVRRTSTRRVGSSCGSRRKRRRS
jgi:hypothetical protein